MDEPPKRTPREIADEWYTVDNVALAIRTNPELAIPNDTRSPEFAAWLTYHFRCAMMNGIQLERGYHES